MLYISYRFNDHPWCAIGDFNVITSTEEKLGGILYNIKKRLNLFWLLKAVVLLILALLDKNSL